MPEYPYSTLQSWIADTLFEGSKERAGKFMEFFINAHEEKAYKKLGKPALENYENFKRARMKILQICMEEKNPERRWEKAKTYLIDNLERTQLDRFRIKNYSPANLIDRLLGDRTYTSAPIKFVACCNFIDSKPKTKHTDNVKIYTANRVNPFDWFYYCDIARVFIIFNDEEYEYRDVPKDRLDDYYSEYLFLEYKGIRRKISKKAFITKFIENHPDFVRAYRISENSSPYDILNQVLTVEHKKKFLSELIGVKGDWKLVTIENHLDPAKITKVHRIKRNPEDVSRCHLDIDPVWKPDTYLIDYDALKYDAVEAYLSKFSFREREAILIQLINMIDIDVFQMQSFREILNLWKRHKIYENIRVLRNTLSFKYSRAKQAVNETGKKYWNIYLDVESLVQSRGCTKQEACEILRSKYDISQRSIWTRYKEKHSLIRKNNLTQDEIIRATGLYEYEIPKLLGAS